MVVDEKYLISHTCFKYQADTIDISVDISSLMYDFNNMGNKNKYYFWLVFFDIFNFATYIGLYLRFYILTNFAYMGFIDLKLQ